MKTEWDYTELAAAYVKRPDYAAEAIDKMLAVAGFVDKNGGGGIVLVTLAQVQLI